MSIFQAIANNVQAAERDFAAGRRGVATSQEAAAAKLAQEAERRYAQKAAARSVESLSPELMELHRRMDRVNANPTEGASVPLEYAALQRAIADTAGDPRQLVAAQLSGAERDAVLQRLAEQNAFSLKGELANVLAGANRTLGREDWVGRTARGGALAGVGGGATAGALGLIELINYLQGNGQDPAA